MSERFAGRRFSWVRFSALLIVCAVLAGYGWFTWSSARDEAQAEASGDPWFAGYVDVTATPTYAFEAAPADDAQDDVVLAFVVAAAPDRCQPTWGAAYTLDEAAAALDLDRRIQRVRSQERDVVVSFGGLLNAELGDACESVDDLRDAYDVVLDRYHLTTIDLDLEGDALTDTAAMARRAEAIAALQQERRDADEELAVWLTLPVDTSGLTPQGTAAVAAFLDAGVDLAGVNAMTMNFAAGGSMAEASQASLESLHRQLDALYTDAGLPLGPTSLWRKIGATPMVGQNDVVADVFEVGDAGPLNAFARERGLGRMSMWSLNRDRACSANYADLTTVSDACSGVEQEEGEFAALLGKGFAGSPKDSAGAETVAEQPKAVVTDDPETSPYPVWSETAAYLAGTKVVWHGSVYEAKWWTSGDVPDDPVLQEWETPWTLVGPVLPGETPAPTIEVPDDLAPQWDPETAYEAGDLVMRNDAVFEARWWTLGDAPEEAFNDPGTSPWLALDEDALRELIADAE
ncbi:carbohydrate-binding protein [Microbacterium sediminis]|uniref:Glycosyl hydrolase family 18 n=1 Tax=Microbacterium sediminis TaxID=904291 RepID=A0A1B9N7U0_9MICO|nr:carbohydrate-binding protein [Microbacterium sediminis]OCG72657.1 glycosyl hydrolase family 18 [Microbacterium sediminis]QBR74830.1 glycosyl hydrolase family 18 [Microbacterium sediminis]